MKKILSFIIIAFCCLSIVEAKQKLKVLYVGGTPNINTEAGVVDNAQLQASIKERMADYGQFLKTYFTTVKVIEGKDYTPEMSSRYDVTIFDGKPHAAREREYVRDANGRITDVINAVYLPFDFDRACICIAEVSDAIGRNIGTKNDWYCLCLDAEAHHWNAQHPIFKGPFTLNIKPVMKPTPSHAYEYAALDGQVLEDSCLMFSIQKCGYETDRNMRIGMVSRPGGYTDSPEAEVISSGVCAKSIDAVAIGRHGNYFHWGFAASPKDMTEEGKTLFANAVAYMAKFNGTHIIARKLDDRMTDRKAWVSQANMVSKEMYDSYVKTIEESNKTMRHYSDSLKALKQAGKEIPQNAAFLLNWKPQEVPSFNEFIREFGRELYPLFGSNVQLYKDYYNYNEPYMYYDMQQRRAKVDLEIRELGIANNDIRLLDKCISMLENNTEVDKATTILQRYTLARFGGAKEWREWFETYKDKMFFSEAGGFVWLINTNDVTVPGNDYSVRTLDKEAQQNAPIVSETDDRNPVALSASVITSADGQKEILIRMKLHPGYHTYLSVSEKDPFIPTEVKIELPKGVTKVGGLVLPSFGTMATGTTIYEGDCLFRQKVSGNVKGKATVTVSYQCCNKDVCLQPTEKVMEVEL